MKKLTDLHSVLKALMDKLVYPTKARRLHDAVIKRFPIIEQQSEKDVPSVRNESFPPEAFKCEV